MAKNSSLTAACAAAFMTLTSPAQAQSLQPLRPPTQEMHEVFCDIARDKGARSWQAISQYDANWHHGGMNLHTMRPQDRPDALRQMQNSTFSPVLQARINTGILSSMEQFDRYANPEKLIKMLGEIQGHGKTLPHVDSYFSTHCS